MSISVGAEDPEARSRDELPTNPTMIELGALSSERWLVQPSLIEECFDGCCSK